MARLPLIVALVALAGCQMAVGQQTTFDSKTTASALSDFVTDLRSSVQSDMATWGTRLDGLRSQYADKAAETRASLSSVSSQSVLTKGWELILDAGSAIKRVMDAKALSVRDFMTDVMGHDWSLSAPKAWLMDVLSWDTLADFEVTHNLQDLLSLDAIRNYQRPENIGQLYTSLENAVDSFCELPDVTHPMKIPSTCTGPSIRIVYIPKSCTLESATKKIMCDPAKLVLHKTPGQCTLKRFTPFIWTGKQCRFKMEVGKSAVKVVGGRQYNIDFTDHLSSTFDAVREHVTPDAPFDVSADAIVGQPLQRTITWIPAEKAPLQGILKYQIICAGILAADTRTLKVHVSERSVVIGVDATGDNRALAPGVTYTCSVAGINVKGTGAAKVAAVFTTPATVEEAAGLPLTQGAADVGESQGPGPIDVWRPDRRAPAVFNTGPLTYMGRTDVINIGVVAAELDPTSYYNTQGRVLAISSNIQPRSSYGVTGDLYIPASWRDNIDPTDTATWRRAGIWSTVLNPNNYWAPNQGYYTISGFQNVPVGGSALPADAFTNPQQFSRFWDWNPTAGYSILQNVPVRYDAWNTITSEVSLSLDGTYTYKNYFNGVLADTFTQTQAQLANGGNCPPSGTGCTQVHMYLQLVNPCSGFSNINAGFCDKTANGGINNCCKGATYDAYWSNVRAYSSAGGAI